MDANAHLTRRHEAPELGAMVTRTLRSLARRAGEGDVEALEELVALEVVMRDQLGAGVAGYRHQGHSWADVAQVTRARTRQAAQQRFAGADPALAHGPRCACGSELCPNTRNGE